MRSLTACDPAEILLAGVAVGARLLLAVDPPAAPGMKLALRDEAADPFPLVLFFFCSAAILSERDEVPAGRFAGRRGDCSDLKSRIVSICSIASCYITQADTTHIVYANGVRQPCSTK
jgi:hypothetical protein